MNQRQLGERLRDRRNTLGLTQQDIADQVGVGQPQVNKWENGTATPAIGRVDRLAAALDLDDAVLYRWIAEVSQQHSAQVDRDAKDIRRQIEAALADLRRQTEQALAAITKVVADIHKVVEENRAVNTEILGTVTRQIETMAPVVDDFLARQEERKRHTNG